MHSPDDFAKGCISEKLLRPRNRGEFFSYSEWETEADINRFTSSAAHKQIVSRMRSVQGASAAVALCDLVNGPSLARPAWLCRDRH
jgi:heme-degrading monooxygenase HmoA